MTRLEAIEFFRQECPEITDRVITDATLKLWCIVGNQEICARARLIVDKDGTTISTTENDEYFDLMTEITNFYSIDEYPGGGVTYNGKRLSPTTIAKLDSESSGWRSRSAGTPKEYYVRGKWLFMDRPIDSNASDIKVYSVLLADDFNDDNKTPYNELTYLEPFHYGIVKYLVWRAKSKVGKPTEALTALQEYLEYIKWIKTEIGGAKYERIFFQPKV